MVLAQLACRVLADWRLDLGWVLEFHLVGWLVGCLLFICSVCARNPRTTYRRQFSPTTCAEISTSVNRWDGTGLPSLSHFTFLHVGVS